MSQLCPKCQAPLPADAPAGLCPRCLLQGGLVSETSDPTAAYMPFTAATVAELAPLFPQLEIIELIGQGGMGAVYKARQPTLDRYVALKILPPRDDPRFAERFVREARALAKLSHPGIVNVYDFGQTGGINYLLMEYVDGVNLRQAQKAGRLTPTEALAIVPKICDALQFAHEASVVHRDIKPENILLDAKGRVKIADFGLAKLLDRPEQPLTGTNQAMGTVHYMAPEQWEKPATVDHRADIYSLGVVFYELLTGELPLGRFPLPSQKVQVDVRLDEVVLRALEKEPDLRYQHASDVKTDVDKIVGEGVDHLTLEEAKAVEERLRAEAARLKQAHQRVAHRYATLNLHKALAESAERFKRHKWARPYLVLLFVFVFGILPVGVIFDVALSEKVFWRSGFGIAWPLLMLIAGLPIAYMGIRRLLSGSWKFLEGPIAVWGRISTLCEWGLINALMPWAKVPPYWPGVEPDGLRFGWECVGPVPPIYSPAIFLTIGIVLFFLHKPSLCKRIVQIVGGLAVIVVSVVFLSNLEHPWIRDGAMKAKEGPWIAAGLGLLMVLFGALSEGPAKTKN